MTAHTPCPCGSGKSYAPCCGVFHSGEAEAPDAESLMRSRYSAFALRKPEYLWRTLHPDHELRRRTETDVLASIRRTCDRTRYMGLTVIDRALPDADGIARVLFLARMFAKGREVSFVEASDFAYDGTGWRYLTGDNVSVVDIPGDPRTLTLASFAQVFAR